ncbi:MAG: peptidyl-prolyl cis-trans isomerase [Nitrospirae bacterium]|nr:peptidyl-prolyl cis-trans isomerase [Nitrospirota bacterium]
MVLAVIDGEPVTEGDIKYALTISHRREDLSSAGKLDLSGYVKRMVDDRLIINEARNAGMDKYPEVQQAVQAYILRESVVRLHDEEIVKKVDVTEEEIKEHYKKIYASTEEFDRVKRRIERKIRKQKEKDRSDEYLKYLREKYHVKIDRELLEAIDPNGVEEERRKWANDKTVVASVNGSVLTAIDFISMFKPSQANVKEDVVNAWIERKLVDHEAVNRHYENDPDFKKMIGRYENQLLKNTFIKRVIIPQISITEEALNEYYLNNQKDFMKPRLYRIQQITVKTMDEAMEILNSVRDGADFSWLAKRYSSDSASSRGGDVGWVTKKELPLQFREGIDDLKIADISPVIDLESSYRIIKLTGRTEDEVEEFDKVKDAVSRALFNEKLDSLLEKYVNELKKEAEIKIYNEEIKSLEEKLQG